MGHWGSLSATDHVAKSEEGGVQICSNFSRNFDDLGDPFCSSQPSSAKAKWAFDDCGIDENTLLSGLGTAENVDFHQTKTFFLIEF